MVWLMKILKICLRIIASHKVLRNKLFIIAKKLEYEKYQHGRA